jgi:uncharacterized membrane protein YfcA
MDGMTIATLVVAGVAGGIVNAVAGGATLITFPAMLHAGLPPIIANASNAVAIMPGHLVAALADRRRLPRFDWGIAGLVVASVGGGGVGAVALLVLPERLFTLPVPVLTAFATLLFAFAPALQARAEGRGPEGARGVGRTATIALASIYGGFFGAGLGVILTAVLSITEAGDIRGIKALKNLLATGVSVVASAIFIVQGAVRWHETLIMLTGAMLGGFAGGHLIRVLPGNWIRCVVILAGAVMSVIYGVHYWV